MGDGDVDDGEAVLLGLLVEQGADAALKDLPVLMITGYAQLRPEEAGEVGQQAGPDGPASPGSCCAPAA